MSGVVFGSLYTLTSLGKALAMKAFEIRVRCKAEHEIVDGETITKHDLELQVWELNNGDCAYAHISVGK